MPKLTTIDRKSQYTDHPIHASTAHVLVLSMELWIDQMIWDYRIAISEIGGTMSALKLLINLYEYKKWSESSIFDYLLAPDQDKFPEAFTKALYYLSHINIVDKIFIARLKGEPPAPTSVVTN